MPLSFFTLGLEWGAVVCVKVQLLLSEGHMAAPSSGPHFVHRALSARQPLASGVLVSQPASVPALTGRPLLCLRNLSLSSL